MIVIKSADEKDSVFSIFSCLCAENIMSPKTEVPEQDTVPTMQVQPEETI